MFQEDQEYLIRINIRGREIIIIDDFTGRTMKGRRWRGGLHQSIEAKHDLRIQPEASVLASISYQNFFLLYPKLSGMTGTAQTEGEEFKYVYDLDVVPIPTNKLFQRRDLPTVIYLTRYAKWRRITEESFTYRKVGRPVLIGTRSIRASEIIASILKYGFSLLNQILNKKDKIKYIYLHFKGYFNKILYQLLNARPENSQRESEIIASAGCLNAITIATNMAGRGTDILLGGNLAQVTKEILSNHINNQNYRLKTSVFYYFTRGKSKQRIKTKEWNYDASSTVYRWIKVCSFAKRYISIKSSGLIIGLNYYSFILYCKKIPSPKFYKHYLRNVLYKLLKRDFPTLIFIHGQLYGIKKSFFFYDFIRLKGYVTWLKNILLTLGILKLRSPLTSPWVLSCFSMFIEMRCYTYKDINLVYRYLYRDQKAFVKYDKKKISNLGGLHVIGTELNYSRRIDNQLRGRAGRQGDFGSSQFFISTEDDTLRNFGRSELKNRFLLRQKKNVKTNYFAVPLRFSFQSQLIDSVQKTIEGIYFSSRKAFFEYEKFVSFQRTYVYSERFKILKRSAEKLHKFFLITDIYQQVKLSNAICALYDYRPGRGLPYIGRQVWVPNLPLSHFKLEHIYFGTERELLLTQQLLEIKFSEQIAFISSIGLYAFMIKNIFLDVIDENWRVQLKGMSELREVTKWLSYGKTNPLTVYAKQGLYTFSKMLIQIRNDIIMETTLYFKT